LVSASSPSVIVQPKAQNEEMGARFGVSSSLIELIIAIGISEIKNLWRDRGKRELLVLFAFILGHRSVWMRKRRKRMFPFQGGTGERELVSGSALA
jgi:hypothetical protein